MKLLVVDDEPSVTKILKRFLESCGHEVAVAENGAVGLAYVQTEAVDLVISDVVMPVMDGYELVKALRKNNRTAGLPIILLSARRESERMIEGYESGADDYVGKPVDMEVLKLKVEVLSRRAASNGSSGTERESQAQLVCVTSAKGGVGVSTVATNLALIFKRRDSSVCLVDMNLEASDLPVLLDVRPTGTMVDAVEMMEIEGKISSWSGLLTPHDSGVLLLSAPLGPSHTHKITDASMKVIMERLREKFDVTVADVWPAYSDLSISTMESADRVVVVVSPEITALRRTAKLLAVFREVGIRDGNVVLVMNQQVEVAGIDVKRAESFLSRKIACSIPKGGRAFTDAVSTGRPVAHTNVPNPALASLVELADLVLPIPKAVA